MNNRLNEDRKRYYASQLSHLNDLVLALRMELVVEISKLDTSENDMYIYTDSINSLTKSILELENCEYDLNKV